MSKFELADRCDEELMELYKSGDSYAFEILFSRHSGTLLAFLRRRIPKDKDAQDILQDVFLKLHRSKHLYDNALPFSPWLFSIARSVWLDCLKKKNLEYVSVSEEIEDRINFLKSHEDGFNFSSEIELNVLNQLPEMQKAAIGLRVVDDATFDEIATKLSTSPENARQLVSRGLKRLRELIGKKQKE